MEEYKFRWCSHILKNNQLAFIPRALFTQCDSQRLPQQLLSCNYVSRDDSELRTRKVQSIMYWKENHAVPLGKHLISFDFFFSEFNSTLSRVGEITPPNLSIQFPTSVTKIKFAETVAQNYEMIAK